MRTAGVREARQNLTELLDDVKKGSALRADSLAMKPNDRLLFFGDVGRGDPEAQSSRLRRSAEREGQPPAVQAPHNWQGDLDRCPHQEGCRPVGQSDSPRG